MTNDKETVDLTHTKEEGISQEILKVLKSFRAEVKGEFHEFRSSGVKSTKRQNH